MKSGATTVAELRAEGVYRILTPDECVALGLDNVVLHPLAGGMPVDEGGAACGCSRSGCCRGSRGDPDPESDLYPEPVDRPRHRWSTAVMTLAVDVFLRDADGQWNVLDVPEGCNDSAGFENWRETVWGSAPVRALGATYLPVLASSDLYVEASDVPEFLREIALLREHLEAVAGDVGKQSDVIGSRLDNIEAAALRAREIGGGVLIW